MIDEQKCAQKHLREVRARMRNTVDARFDYVIERLTCKKQ